MGIVMALLGCLTAITGWPFGPVQIVGVIIFIGMSVDYSLHLTHGFNQHRLHDDSTKKAMSLSLREIGMSILGGAATTAGATWVLFPCWIHLFLQLGAMMFTSTILSLLFAKLFLAPLLMICGPPGRWNIYALPCWRKFCLKDSIVIPCDGDAVEMDDAWWQKAECRYQNNPGSPVLVDIGAIVATSPRPDKIGCTENSDDPTSSSLRTVGSTPDNSPCALADTIPSQVELLPERPLRT